jgi:hypothetical protein
VAILLAPSLAKATTGTPFIERVAATPGVTAVGYVSAIQGKNSPEQVLLDVSAGARVQTSLYKDDLPEHVTLAPEGSAGRINAWPQIAARARTPPADI